MSGQQARFPPRKAGVVVACKSPPADQAENPGDYPGFIQPHIEPERCAAGSYCVNGHDAHGNARQFRCRAVLTRVVMLSY